MSFSKPLPGEIWEYQTILIDALKYKGRASLADADVNYVNHGQDKFVFRIPSSKLSLTENPVSDLIAVAVPKSSAFDLYQEWSRLKQINEAMGSEFVPKHQEYTETPSTAILLMEYILFPVSSQAKPTAELAYNLGRAVGCVYAKTGLYHVEPPEENILVSAKNEVKFVDAICFEEGSIDDILETYMSRFLFFRPEIAEYPDSFEEGLNNHL